MQDQKIICPYCRREIPLTEAIAHEIRDQLRNEFEEEARKKDEQLAHRERSLQLREEGLEKTRQSLDKTLAERLKAEKDKLETTFDERMQSEFQRLEKEAREKAEGASALELKDLRAQVHEKDERLQEAQDAELELRKEKRQLEEKKKAFELEMNRRLDAERQKIKEEATKSLTEEYRLKELDKAKLIGDLRRQIDELKRKAEQGSQESQGEVLELELEDVLKANCRLDHIEPVPRGKRGADVLQRVHNNAGQYCGTIIWESKRTKTWNEGWIEKLKDDQRESKAEIAAILTIAMPEGVQNFGYYNGVWVANYSSLVGLATALRINLMQIAETNSAALGKTEKMEVLYAYLSGPAFRQKVEGIVEAFVAMRQDLDAEKRAMGRIWAKREKQVERIVTNTVSMYGDMQGIIGASLPEIKSLQLKALAPGDDSKEEDMDADNVPF